MSLESSFVFHAVSLSPWEVFGLLSFYRIVVVYRFIVLVNEIPNYFLFDIYIIRAKRASNCYQGTSQKDTVAVAKTSDS